MQNKNFFFHFSIDDVFDSLIEVTDKKISLKKHYFFKEIYNLWKMYGIRTGLHLFYQKKINGKIRNLSEIRDISSELGENWIYFNVHALDPETPPYKQSIKDQKKTFKKIFFEIKRFAGNKYLSINTRLHYYSECYELAEYFNENNVKALFSTDRNIGSHRMPKKISDELLNFGKSSFKKLKFIRTDLRVEWLAKNKIHYKDLKEKISRILNKKKILIIYSHEYEFKKKNVIYALRKIMNILSKKLYFRNIKP